MRLLSSSKSKVLKDFLLSMDEGLNDFKEAVKSVSKLAEN